MDKHKAERLAAKKLRRRKEWGNVPDEEAFLRRQTRRYLDGDAAGDEE